MKQKTQDYINYLYEHKSASFQDYFKYAGMNSAEWEEVNGMMAKMEIVKRGSDGRMYILPKGEEFKGDGYLKYMEKLKEEKQKDLDRKAMEDRKRTKDLENAELVDERLKTERWQGRINIVFGAALTLGLGYVLQTSKPPAPIIIQNNIDTAFIRHLLTPIIKAQALQQPAPKLEVQQKVETGQHVIKPQQQSGGQEQQAAHQ